MEASQVTCMVNFCIFTFDYIPFRPSSILYVCKVFLCSCW